MVAFVVRFYVLYKNRWPVAVYEGERAAAEALGIKEKTVRILATDSAKKKKKTYFQRVDMTEDEWES